METRSSRLDALTGGSCRCGLARLLGQHSGLHSTSFGVGGVPNPPWICKCTCDGECVFSPPSCPCRLQCLRARHPPDPPCLAWSASRRPSSCTPKGEAPAHRSKSSCSYRLVLADAPSLEPCVLCLQAHAGYTACIDHLCMVWDQCCCACAAWRCAAACWCGLSP